MLLKHVNHLGIYYVNILVICFWKVLSGEKQRFWESHFVD